MHILCPHCRNAIEVVQFDAREEIACPSCGSGFRLEGGSTTGHESGPGERLGKFELIDVLGHGAFGTVYKARDPELDRVVALKVPRTGNQIGPKELDRFLREARSAAQLRHPSIVAVHDVGTADGVPYLVSDFVQGVTLADLLSAKRPPFRETAEMVAAVADALQYAHDRGVVHRDVKPSNIMVGVDGRPCVMDFGLAKRDAGEITMTVEGQVLGTPAYMPPEQARGEGHRVDSRADVYSVGVILYQMLTGELPFRGTARMVLHQVLQDEPRPPRSLNDAIPRDLETVTLKAMAKEPGRRYQSARELADDLRRWLAGKGILARPAGRLERAWLWARRRPAAAALVAVSGLASLALVALAVSAMFLVSLDEARRSEEEARLGESEQRKKVEESLAHVEAARSGEAVERRRAEAALELADSVSYAHAMFLADQALRENNVAAAEARLRECKVKTGWEWRYLMARCRPELFSFAGSSAVFSPDGSRVAARGHDGQVPVHDVVTGREVLRLKAGDVKLFHPVFSPDGDRIAVGGGDGVVRIYDARTGREAQQFKAPVPVRDLMYSPDGARIAVKPESSRRGGDGALRLYDARTGQGPVVLKSPAAMYGVAFSPDGTRLAVGCDDEVMRLYDVGTGKKVVRLKPPAAVSAPAFSPDGTRIVCKAPITGIGPGFIHVCDARTGEGVFKLEIPEPVGLPRFSPDGTRIAVGCGDGVIRLFDPGTGRELVGLKAPKGFPTPVFSPDGARIALGGGDRVVRLHDARTGQELFQINAPSVVFSLVFSPDGTRLAVGPDQYGPVGTVRVYDARRAPGPVLFQTQWGNNTGWFSRDGARLSVSGRDGVVRLHDPATGRELVRLQSAGALSAPILSPDGRLIVAMSRPGGGGREVRLFDARTGREGPLLQLPGPGKGGPSYSYTPFNRDGSRIALTPDYSVGNALAVVCDTRTGREVLRIKADAPVGVAVFSPDGGQLALAPSGSKRGDGVVRVYDASTGRELFRLKSSLALGIPSYSPDGSRIVGSMASTGGLLPHMFPVFDARTGRELFQARSPVGIRMPKFNRDGSQLAATDGEGAVRVYDGRTGRQLLWLKGPSRFFQAAFSPDGTRIACLPTSVGGNGDGVIRLYDATTGQEVFQLKEPVTLDDEGEFSPDSARFVTRSVGQGEGTLLRVYEAPVDLDAWHARRRAAFPEGLPPWHRDRAEASEQGGDWFAAAFHWARLTAAEGDNGLPHLRHGLALARLRRPVDASKAFEASLAGQTVTPHLRAQALAMLGRFREAAALVAEAVESLNGTPEVSLHHAVLLLQQGDQAGYQKACATTLARFGKTREASVAQAAARTCALAPRALTDLKPAVDLARRAAGANGKDANARTTLGAILYRSGRHKEAVAELNEAIKLNPEGGSPFDHVFLAMAHRGLDRAGEARKSLEQAKQAKAKFPPVIWDEKLTLELLIREAEELILPKKDARK